jgi:N-formylglutamate amidohydrolase
MADYGRRDPSLVSSMEMSNDTRLLTKTTFRAKTCLKPDPLIHITQVSPEVAAGYQYYHPRLFSCSPKY